MIADQRPHSRACGLYCRGHGTACSRDCPTCGGADATPSPTGSADATPSFPSWRRPDSPQRPQTGPGWVMTSHGPIRRAMPPWDVSASPDPRRPHPGGYVEPPAGQQQHVVELWTSAAVDQLLTGLGIPLASVGYTVERQQWESSGEATVRIIAELQGIYRLRQ